MNRRYTPGDVAKYYDEVTEQYLKISGEILQGYRSSDDGELLDYTMKSAGLRPGERILDAGCGVAGPATYFASRMDVAIDCVTISPVQYEIARKRIEAAGLSGRVSVATADYHELDTAFEAERFDRVLFLESLGHAENPARVIGATHAIVKPGGLVYVKDFFSKTSETGSIQEKIERVVENMNQAFCYNALDLNDTLESFRSLDFEVVYIKRPDFVLDRTKPRQFEAALGIDYFAGVGEPFAAIEWLEMLLQKGV